MMVVWWKWCNPHSPARRQFVCVMYLALQSFPGKHLMMVHDCTWFNASVCVCVCVRVRACILVFMCACVHMADCKEREWAIPKEGWRGSQEEGCDQGTQRNGQYIYSCARWNPTWSATLAPWTSLPEVQRWHPGLVYLKCNAGTLD